MKKYISHLKFLSFFFAIGAISFVCTIFAVTPSFQILTESESKDYIGQNQSWDFSSSNNSKLIVSSASKSSVSFMAESFDISNMSFEFSSEDGKTLSRGLFSPAKRNAFRGSYNGINVSGDGRGCNEVLGGFYVHEYSEKNGVLEKAAIDFVHSCKTSTGKMYGSLRYNSGISNSCANGDCSKAKEYLGLIDTKTSYVPVTNIQDASVQRESRKNLLLKRRQNVEVQNSTTKIEYETPVVTAKKSFPDLEAGSEEALAAGFLANKNIIGGRPNGNFDGEAMVNRAEVSKFLLLSKEIEVDNLKNNDRFPDLSEGEWYVKYVIKAADLGIINGYPDGTFAPARKVNTAEFLKMFSKTFSIPEIVNTYQDVPGNLWYDEYAGAAQKYNLFPNRDNLYLEPSRELTRNEVAVAIYQYLNASQVSEFENRSVQKSVSHTSSDRKEFDGDYFSFTYLSDWELSNISSDIVQVFSPEDKSDLLREDIAVIRQELTGDDKATTLEELKDTQKSGIEILLNNVVMLEEGKRIVDGIVFYERVFKGDINDRVVRIYSSIAKRDDVVYSVAMGVPEKLSTNMDDFGEEYEILMNSLNIYVEKKERGEGVKRIDSKSFSLEIPNKWDYSDLGYMIAIDPFPENDSSSLAFILGINDGVSIEERNKGIEGIEEDTFESDRYDYQDRELISSKTVSINSNDYREHIFTHRVGDVWKKNYRLIKLSNDAFYFILFEGEEVDYEEAFPQIKAALDSLILK